VWPLHTEIKENDKGTRDNLLPVTAEHRCEVTHFSTVTRRSLILSAAAESTCFKPHDV
jgi:hypothetical protein